jgi:hypothetical protein
MAANRTSKYLDRLVRREAWQKRKFASKEMLNLRMIQLEGLSPSQRERYRQECLASSHLRSPLYRATNPKSYWCWHCGAWYTPDVQDEYGVITETVPEGLVIRWEHGRREIVPWTETGKLEILPP